VIAMRQDTRLLRWLSGLLLFGLLLCCGVLYVLSIESADSWPELAHLRLPIYLAVVVGFIPVALGIKSVFGLLQVIDRGEVFSVVTLQLLHRLRLLIGAFAGYFALGLVGFWMAVGMMHPTLLLGWFALEVAALFGYTTVALLERIFTAAIELREDHDLTV
jgi:hypothetical protein